MIKTQVRLAIERYIKELDTKLELPIRGCILCPKCNGMLHFVLYASRRLEVRCANNCFYWGDL